MKKFGLMLALFVHNIFGKITADGIRRDAQEIEAGVNFVDAVKTDCKGITDPAALATAVCKSVIEHKDKLPANLQGLRFVTEAENIAAEISGLPLSAIEAELKLQLSLLKTAA